MKKKNILYFTRTMDIGGTEKVILQLLKSFNKDFNKIVVCSAGGIHEKYLQDMEIKHYKINDIQSKNILNIIKTLLTLIKVIKNENINIVHTHHRMAAFYTSLLNKMFKFKFIHTAHNTFMNKKILTRVSLNNARIIAVGNKVKNNLCDFYKISSNKVTVIYNGIEMDNNPVVHINEIKKYKDKDYFVVGNIGRLNEQKGMEYYIRAIPKVIKKNNKIIFFIIGDGEQKQQLQDLIRNLNISKNVILLGYRADILNVIKQLDVVILSSLWEGLPLTPIEAFSVKKTVIGTSVDGTQEIIENNYNGILIEPKNSSMIAQAVINISKDKNFKSILEKNAFNTYKLKFSYEIFMERYKAYYEKNM